MSDWKIACVQMDCGFADTERNLSVVKQRLQTAAEEGARLVVFPECALTGYAYSSKEEAWPIAQAIPNGHIDEIIADCRRLNVWAVVGSLERVTETGDLFNVAVLVGPNGIVDVYRKIHLPYLGVDRFTTPGDKPFAVHDLGGLCIGMNICYDGSFPEASRCLTLLGADLIVLPTNWPPGAVNNIHFLVQARASENHVFYAACNRVGEERGCRFIGQSRIIDVRGNVIADAPEYGEKIIYATITPQTARDKHLANIPGEYELHRIAQRRPEMYGELVKPVNEKFVPKGSPARSLPACPAGE